MKGLGLAPRDQARRLSPHDAPGWPQGALILTARSRWSDRFPRIGEALASLRARSTQAFVMVDTNGQAVSVQAQ